MSSESSRLINQLDPENGHQEIVSLLTNYEFPWDIEKALEFALFRTYAGPSISALLAETALEFFKIDRSGYRLNL